MKSQLSTAKVRVVPLAYKVLLQTTGTDNTVVFTDVDLPVVENWGPHLVGITAHTNPEQFSTLFRWKLVMYWSMDAISWSSPVDVFAGAGTAGQVIQTAFTDATKFGLHIRFALACYPSSGTNREWGTTTVVLAFEFKS